MVQVKFLVSPTFEPWFLAYSAGQTAELPAARAKALVEAGVAEYTGVGVKESEQREKAVSKDIREKR